MENQTYNWRWRLAQYLELRWWQRYLKWMDWDQYMAKKRLHWQQLLLQLEIQLVPGERVLEAGCGPAGIFIILGQQRVDAIDPLLDKYEKELPHFQRAAFPYVHFQSLMLEQLEAKAAYDAVFCLNAINHVANLDLALQRLIEAIKPDGILVLTVDVHRHSWLKFIFRLIPGDALHPQQDERLDYLRALEKKGLIIEKELILKKGLIFNYIGIKAKKKEWLLNRS